MDLTGKTFVYFCGDYGDVVFEVTSGPIVTTDESHREFVWAKAIGRKRNRRGRVPWRLPLTKGPFFLPLTFIN